MSDEGYLDMCVQAIDKQYEIDKLKKEKDQMAERLKELELLLQVRSEAPPDRSGSGLSNDPRYYTVDEIVDLIPLRCEDTGIVSVGRLADFGEITVKQFLTFYWQSIPRSEYKKEIDILIKCRHPNIVNIYGILWDGRDKSNPLGYLMENFDENLHDRIYNMKISYDFSHACSWILQIARGLCCLHKEGIIHRDIKPSNICIIGKQLKLSDFVIAKNIDASTTEGAGTICYMAPETFTGVRCSLASDIYSLAITAWEIFHRKIPYSELTNNAFDVMPMVLGGKRPTIDLIKINMDTAEFFQTWWSMDQASRPSSKEIVDFFTKIDLSAQHVALNDKPHDTTPYVDANGIIHYKSTDFTGHYVDGGGYGCVLKGCDRDGQAVAVKRFFKPDTYSVSFTREIFILQKHNHANIVEILGVICDGNMDGDNPVYLGYVMEYMELGSLHKAIHESKETYDSELITKWIHQIAEGLKYLHANKIIHRDIKPKNILLAARNHIKLADFGEARTFSDRNTNTSGFIGTDLYRAPEVLNSKSYGPSADVYSLGVTIAEIVTRKHPWEYNFVKLEGMDGGLKELVKRFITPKK